LSKEPVILVEGASKCYPVQSAAHAGLKKYILNLPSRLRHRAPRRVFHALKNISFSVDEGECLGLMGRNGSGKSTALSLIAGVIRPDEGRVTTRGRICPLLELGAGFHPDLTGRENIVLNGVLLGMLRREVQKRSEDIIAFSELGTFIEEPIRTYSMGMLARLGFSVAVHLDPQILLVDEILSVGDAAFQAKCMDRFRQFQNRGVTTLFVSHDLATVKAICNRAILLTHGEMRTNGPVEEAAAYYDRILSGTAT